MKSGFSRRMAEVVVIAAFTLFNPYGGEPAENSGDSSCQNTQNEEVQEAEDTQLFLAQKAAPASSKPGTTKKRQPIVVIDPGHGGFDPGAVGINKSVEKNNALSVALKLGRELQNKGIKVIYTRQSDKIAFPAGARANLNARAQVANTVNADLFVSIHNNSSIYRSVNGIETYYCEGSSKSKILAGYIQNQLVKDMKSRNRGIRSSDFYVLKNTKNPAALIELGYITNKNEEEKLRNSKTQDKYASAIAAGIMKYLSR